MEVKVTCAGCEVTVEEIDGKCVVIATKDGEVMEEFSVDCEETDGETEDVEEIEDEIEDEDEMEDEDEDEDEEMSESVKSFGEFFEKKD